MIFTNREPEMGFLFLIFSVLGQDYYYPLSPRSGALYLKKLLYILRYNLSCIVRFFLRILPELYLRIFVVALWYIFPYFLYLESSYHISQVQFYCKAYLMEVFFNSNCTPNQ